jgi:hypothetical protein
MLCILCDLLFAATTALQASLLCVGRCIAAVAVVSRDYACCVAGVLHPIAAVSMSCVT